MYKSKAAESPSSVARISVRAATRKLNAQVLSYFSQHQDELLHLLAQRVSDLASRKGHYADEKVRSWQDAQHCFGMDAVTFFARFLAALETSLSEEIHTITLDRQRQHSAITPSAHQGDELNLSLVGVAEMDQMLLLDEVVKRFNLRYEEPLAVLTMRLRVLFGRETPSLQGNPYRPEILLRAFQVALESCSFDERSAQNVLQAFDPEHCIDLAPLYRQLDQLLEHAGVTTQLHRVRKSRSSGLAPGAVAAVGDDTYAYPGLVQGVVQPGFLQGGAGVVAADYPGGVPGELPAGRFGAAPVPAYGYCPPGAWSTMSHAREFLLRQGLSQAPAGTAAPREPMTGLDQWGARVPGASEAAPAPVPIEPYLVRYLDELRVNVVKTFLRQGLDIDSDQPNLLREMSGDEEIRSAQEFDRGTVDALAEVFDFVFSDPDIALPLKTVIGRLQIPVLKAALTDREFFLSPQHPARKLVDALAAAAVAWTPDKGLEDPLYLQIETTVKRVLAEFDRDLALFNDALLEFEEFQAATEQRITRQIQPMTRMQEAEEELEEARSEVDLLLQKRIVAMPDDNDRTAFLLPFLTEQWREVLVRAYVNRSAQPDDWAQLLATTDQLLWSTQHKRNSEERHELVAVLPGLVRQLNASLDALDWNGDEREAFTRRLIAAHMNAIRSSIDPAQDAAVPDAQDVHAGTEAVSLLDQRIAAAQDTEPDYYDGVVQGFERGMWFDFLGDEGQIHRCRLSWVSPRRKRFLFTNREGGEAFARPGREIAELLRQGRLTALFHDPLVTRAIDHIMATPEVSAAA